MSDADTPSWALNHKPAPPQRWKPGQSGNPKGRPKGVPNKRTLLIQSLADEAPAIIAALIEKAKAGDTAAAGLLIARVIPALRPRAEPVSFELDTQNKSLTQQGQQVLQAMADGDLDPDTSKMVLDAISSFAGLRQVDDLAARLDALEGRIAKGPR
jgi:hypothetical protein